MLIISLESPRSTWTPSSNLTMGWCPSNLITQMGEAHDQSSICEREGRKSHHSNSAAPEPSNTRSSLSTTKEDIMGILVTSRRRMNRTTLLINLEVISIKQTKREQVQEVTSIPAQQWIWSMLSVSQPSPATLRTQRTNTCHPTRTISRRSWGGSRDECIRRIRSRWATATTTCLITRLQIPDSCPTKIFTLVCTKVNTPVEAQATSKTWTCQVEQSITIRDLQPSQAPPIHLLIIPRVYWRWVGRLSGIFIQAHLKPPDIDQLLGLVISASPRDPKQLRQWLRTERW